MSGPKLGLLVLLLLLPGLAATASAGSDGSAGFAIQPPAKRCGAPRHRAAVVRLSTSDHVSLDGAVVGTGRRGIALVHEAGSQALCGWWPYAVRLAQHGFQALVFDLRCYGRSACPAGARRDDVVADVAAAVAALRRRGCRSISIVGASYGGSVALVAAARLPGIAALADLSGDENTTAMVGSGRRSTALEDAPRLRIPVLLALARNDPFISLPDERALFARIRSPHRRLVVLPASAGHGWDMLVSSTRGSAWSPFERTLTTFLALYTRRP